MEPSSGLGNLQMLKPSSASAHCPVRPRIRRGPASGAASARPPAANVPWKLPSTAPPSTLGIEPPPGLDGAKAMPRFHGNAGKQEAQSGLLLPPGLSQSHHDADAHAETATMELEPRRVPVAAAFGVGAATQGSAHVGPTYELKISGLPNKLLTEVMLEAVLEQAGLDDDVISMVPRTGKPSGHVLVTLSSFEMVERCVRHFNGRQWDPSGAMVRVDIVSVTKGLPEVVEQNAATNISAKAPIFELESSFKAEFSADAPAFVPKNKAISATEDEAVEEDTPAGSWGRAAGARRKCGIVISSDTSTEVGESEAEDEQSQDVLVAATA